MSEEIKRMVVDRAHIADIKKRVDDDAAAGDSEQRGERAATGDQRQGAAGVRECEPAAEICDRGSDGEHCGQ